MQFAPNVALSRARPAQLGVTVVQLRDDATFHQFAFSPPSGVVGPMELPSHRLALIAASLLAATPCRTHAASAEVGIPNRSASHVDLMPRTRCTGTTSGGCIWLGARKREPADLAFSHAKLRKARKQTKSREQAMMSLRVLGAAVIVASAVSSPASAQAVFSNPAACSSQFASANCLNRGAGSPYDSRRGYYQRRTAYREPVGPVGAAAGVAGAAVGTAAAIATAPFGGWRNSYAAYGTYDRPAAYGDYYAWNGDWNSYASHNGIVCRPGTFFKGSDGLQHPCQ
ncbi:hypothetical protein ACVIHI_005749 [Bradyrhizobium sp. USDA 4524]|uniref:hypothetical protein n=1 Tax=unclassified Bradyrhizobium TaxID=2631580 RepID=UPI00281283EC|nr:MULTISPECIES: hypothetical protein [unclassified Bradyrhizobium]MCP1841330.1 hypothetical protein [Bradyrhizobium sp. USDA 4538]MCP1901894.1 hypothetical protein [Bradyrhizobium sp. USDA 4537]MCP1992449.1 hypothetical protein [Bradyrhizobium sp. USDA 4539]